MRAILNSIAKPVLALRLVLTSLIVWAPLAFASATFGQEIGTPVQRLPIQSIGLSRSAYVVSIVEDSVSIRIAPGVDPWTGTRTPGLTSIDISVKKQFTQPRPIALQLDICGGERPREIRLTADAEEVRLIGDQVVEMDFSMRTYYSYTFELTGAQYQRVVTAETLAIKLSGDSFLLTREHIHALRRITEEATPLVK